MCVCFFLILIYRSSRSKRAHVLIPAELWHVDWEYFSAIKITRDSYPIRNTLLKIVSLHLELCTIAGRKLPQHSSTTQAPLPLKNNGMRKHIQTHTNTYTAADTVVFYLLPWCNLNWKYSYWMFATHRDTKVQQQGKLENLFTATFKQFTFRTNMQQRRRANKPSQLH